MSKSPVRIPHNWSPRSYQMPVWKYLENGGKRADWCVHRKGGKDLVGLSWTAVSAMKRPGVYWHILPQYNQARKTIWEGRTNDGRPYLDVFGPEKGGIIKRMKENEMLIEFVNGSIWQIQGADEPSKLVGPNPVGVVFSEWSLMSKDIYHLTVQPILESNGGWAFFIYTPRGRNHAYEQRERQANDPDWFVEKLTIDQTKDETGKPIVSRARVDAMRKEGVPEAIIQQEYYCSFEAPMRGAYYENEMKRALDEQRITKVPWEPALIVNTSWDLGVNDRTVLWFFQEHGREIRVIDCYASSGESLPHYAKIMSEKPYVYGEHYAPHDIEVKEFIGGSRIEAARKLGIRFRTVDRNRVGDRIEAVRNMLPRCWIDEEKCRQGIEALKGYCKEWNDRDQCFRNTPKHDWCSDFADSFGYYAQGRRDRMAGAAKRSNRAKSDYPLFGYV